MDEATRKKLEDVKRLMEGASTVGEAEAAAAAMQRLIFRYNLTAADVESLGKSTKESYEVDWIRVGDSRTPGLQWKLNLLWLLAEYNFCQFIRRGHHGGEGVLVGQDTNKQAVREMLDVTIATIERISVSEWHRVHNNFTEWAEAGFPRAMAYKNSFKLGFVTGLRLKMQLERKSELLGDTQANALVIVKDHELQQAVEEKVGKTTKQTGSQPTNAAGYVNGVKKGRAHELRERLG